MQKCGQCASELIVTDVEKLTKTFGRAPYTRILPRCQLLEERYCCKGHRLLQGVRHFNSGFTANAGSFRPDTLDATPWALTLKRSRSCRVWCGDYHPWGHILIPHQERQILIESVDTARDAGAMYSTKRITGYRSYDLALRTNILMGGYMEGVRLDFKSRQSIEHWQSELNVA